MIPISVRLANRAVDRHITKRLGDLSFRSIAPGGFASASFSLQSPIDRNDPMLSPYTRVYIYNHNGNVLWEGRLQIPGRSATEQGSVWALSALGPSSLTTDRTVPLIYIDNDMTRWKPRPGNHASAEVGQNADPLGTETQALRTQFPQGATIATSSVAGLVYDTIYESGMQLGAFGFSWNSGAVDAAYTVQSVTGFAGARNSEAIDSATMNGSTIDANAAFVGDDFPATRTHLQLRLVRTGAATTVGSANAWAQYFSVRVLGRRYNRFGTLASSAAAMASSVRVRASEVVEDLLGRILTEYDGPGATVTTSPTDIDQLAYPDGATPAKVLEDLLALEPSYTWGAWESDTEGLYRFEFKPKPTVVRYEATVGAGADFPPPSWEQYNRVAVRWLDLHGGVKWTYRTQAIPEMDDEGVVREAFIDQADEVGSAANAITAGDEFLAEHRYPPTGGTLRVGRQIIDLIAGCAVDPWAIRPGELIRVRGIEGSVDALNASARDGVTVFWIVAVDVSSDGTASLELDAYPRTDQRAVAELIKQNRYTSPAQQPRKR